MKHITVPVVCLLIFVNIVNKRLGGSHILLQNNSLFSPI